VGVIIAGKRRFGVSHHFVSDAPRLFDWGGGKIAPIFQTVGKNEYVRKYRKHAARNDSFS
jgi:hypothetical protein